MTAEIVDFKDERAARKPRLGNRIVPRSPLLKRARLVRIRPESTAWTNSDLVVDTDFEC